MTYEARKTELAEQQLLVPAIKTSKYSKELDKRDRNGNLIQQKGRHRITF